MAAENVIFSIVFMSRHIKVDLSIYLCQLSGVNTMEHIEMGVKYHINKAPVQQNVLVKVCRALKSCRA